MKKATDFQSSTFNGVHAFLEEFVVVVFRSSPIWKELKSCSIFLFLLLSMIIWSFFLSMWEIYG